MLGIVAPDATKMHEPTSLVSTTLRAFEKWIQRTAWTISRLVWQAGERTLLEGKCVLQHWFFIVRQSTSASLFSCRCRPQRDWRESFSLSLSHPHAEQGDSPFNISTRHFCHKKSPFAQSCAIPARPAFSPQSRLLSISLLLESSFSKKHTHAAQRDDSLTNIITFLTLDFRSPARQNAMYTLSVPTMES